MAGIQQAVNALTGAYGTVAGRVGIYNELVGKNKELIEKLSSKNEELEKKNRELENKDKTINIQKESLSIGDELLERYMSDRRNMYIRNMEHERAQQSKRSMLDLLYQQPTEETPFFKKEDKGGK